MLYLSAHIALWAFATFSFGDNSTGVAPYLVRETETNVTMPVGGQARFFCKMRGKPRPFMLWYKGDNLVNNFPSRITMSKYALRIDDVVQSDAGEYRCVGTNQNGRKCVTFTLSLQEGPPTWSRHMKNMSTVSSRVYRHAKLRCPARGYPTPTIHWLKDGLPFTSSVLNQAKRTKWRLTIRKLLPGDSGQYTCVISNPYGSINWTYTLNVTLCTKRLNHRAIIVDPQHQTVTVGDTALFTCTVLCSDSPAFILWLRHHPVSSSFRTGGENSHVTVIQETANNSNPGQLRLRNVTIADAGWYSCVVSNASATESRKALLTVVKGDVLSSNSPDPEKKSDTKCTSKSSTAQATTSHPHPHPAILPLPFLLTVTWPFVS